MAALREAPPLRLEDAPPVMGFPMAAELVREVMGRDRLALALHRGEVAGTRLAHKWLIPKVAIQALFDRLSAQAEAEAAERAAQAAAAEAAAEGRRRRMRGGAASSRRGA